MKNCKHLLFLFLLLGCSVLSIGQSRPVTKKAAPATTQSPTGFLSDNELPNSVMLLPPPPNDTSVAFELDEFLATNFYLLVDEDRKLLAIQDADSDVEKNQPFNSVLDIKISKDGTPALFNLMLGTLIDAVRSTNAAKEKYKRIRPFMYNNNYTCTPLDEPGLRENGSYPSAHSAGGWAQALVLSEIFPELSDKILVRGKEFGISRNVCNAHWHSDVVAGRMMGTATVARLQSNKAFQDALKKAMREVASLKK